MSADGQECLFCRSADRLQEVGQQELHRDPHWRVTSLASAVVPMVFLSAVRHTAYLWDLDAEQERSLGSALSRTSAALRTAADAELVLTCGFGQQVRHCHFALLAYRPGDPLIGLQGNIVEGAGPADPQRLAEVYGRLGELISGATLPVEG